MDLEARYELLEKIGTGSFATVYRARDLELGREVAVKQIHQQFLDDPAQLERYWQEAQLLASLHHPNIVTIFDIHRDRGWLIMELMQANLADRMSGRQMPIASVRTTLAHSLRALKYLHARGIIHGDIKLSNMMIDARRRIKIGDFGLARRVSDDEGSLLKGTTKYMAPEVVSDEFGEVGPASDLYSLGFAGYELMCGPNFETLFPGLSAFGRNKQVAWMMWHAAPDRRLPEISRVLEGVPDDLALVIPRLCEKNQAKRYATADEALSDLNIDIKLVKGSEDDTDGEADAADAPDRRRRMLLIAAMCVSVLMSLLILFVPGESEDSAQASAKIRYGVVREVLPDAGRIVVEDLETGIPEEFQIGKRPKIYFHNSEKNILLRELQEGDRVEVEIPTSGESQVVTDIVAARPLASRGRVKQLDPSANRIVVAIEEGDTREDLTLRVPERARVELNSSKVELRALNPGDQVEVAHLPEAGRKPGRIVDHIEARRVADGDGFIARVDPATRQVTVRFGLGNTAGRMSLPVAEDADIRLQSGSPQGTQPLNVAELQEDDRIRFRYDTEFREILVNRDEKKLTGAVVQRVDPAAQTFTVSQQNGTQQTFGLTPTGKVMLSLEPVPLESLRQYDNVDITFDATNPQRPLATAIFATRPPQADRWMIIIAEEKYDDFLTPLPYAIDNANLIRQAVTTRYAVAENRLLLLVDQDSASIKRQITDLLSNVRAQTQVVVYICTHAYVGDDERVYLAARDFNWDRMPETGLPLDWLAGQLEAVASKDKILLLDTCHSGNREDLSKQPSSAEMIGKLQTPLKTTAAIASCREGERGLIWKEKQYGLFAWFVAQAFGGQADTNRDLHLTPQELFESLRDRMASADISGNLTQTPQLFSPR